MELIVGVVTSTSGQRKAVAEGCASIRRQVRDGDAIVVC
jgi:hypothetical protein